MLSCTLRRVLPAFAPLALIAVTAVAQTNTTSYSGVVFDPAGARLPDATVLIENLSNGAKQDFVTSKQGEYSFPQVLPGRYKVTITHDGFAEQVRTLELFIATPLTQNITLTVGATGTTIEVTTDTVPSALNLTDASLGKAFNQDMIQTLPYLANNTLSLLALQPGTIAFDANNTTDARAGAINGARQDQTNLTLDGVDNNDANYGYAFTGVLRATRDSIQEFRVTTSGANADSGRSSGAQVALETKAGTNHVHGSAYYYYRQPGLASNNWFGKQTQLSSGQPNIATKVLQHTFGGSLGLPILKDRLFFFGAYEGYKQASNTVVGRTVPLGLRNGTVTYVNASNTTTTLNPTQIASLDRACTTSCPNGRGVNSAALAFMNRYPVSNAVGGDSYNTGGFSFVSPAPVSQVTNITRLDYKINSKQSLFVRGNLQSDNILSTFQFPGTAPSSNTYGNSRGIAAGHIFNISDRAINNFRYGWTRFGTAVRGGVSNDYVTFAAFNALAPTTSSTLLIENTNNFADDFTLVRGRHTIQFGGNDRLIYNQRTLTGTLYKSANVTQSYLAIGSIANTGTSLDANSNPAFPKIAKSFYTSYDQAITAATGLITYAQQYVNYAVNGNSLSPLAAGTVPTRQFRNFEQEYYVQDQWKPTSTLTLTFGLRYAYLGVPFEVNGQQVRPTSSITGFLKSRVAGMKAGTSYNSTISVAPGGKANHAPDFWTAQTANFAPRFAFNYSPDGKTSIRGGFMLAYDHFGQGAVNIYNDSYSFGLSSLYNSKVGQDVDTTPRFTSGTAVPLSITPTPSPGGSFPVTNLGGLGYITQTFDDGLKTPYSEIFNFSLQREISKGLTFTATYTGRLGRHLLVNNDVAMPLNLTDTASGQDYFGAMTQLDKYVDQNVDPGSVPQIAYWQNMFPNARSGTYRGTQAVYNMVRSSRGNETATLYTLDGGTTASPSGQSFRFFHPQFSSLYAQSSIAVSNYNALQISVRHALGRNFIYDVNYTYSKAMDMGSSPERGSSTTAFSSNLANTIINTFNPSQMYAVADFDARHALNGDWTVMIPYGHGLRFGANANRAMEALLGGWMLTGVAKYNSALPFSAIGNAGWGTNWDIRSYDVQIAPVNNPGHHSYTPNSSGLITASAFGGGTSSAAAAATAFASFRQAYVGETGQRNTLRADGYLAVDSGINKSFKTFEGQSLRLTLEGFNVFNNTRFASPGSGSSASTVDFGRYTSARGLLNSPRQLQYSARYYF